MLSYAPEEQMTVIDTSDQQKIFHLFLDVFGSSIAEYSNFNQNVKANKLFQRSCTVSDEAYGIFTLERCWNTWLKEIKNNKKEPPRSSEFTKKNSNKKCGGWTEEGLRRFTSIANLVAISRESDQRKNSEELYRQTQLQKMLHDTGYKSSEQQCIGELREAADESFIPYNDFPDPTNDCISENEVETCNESSKYMTNHTNYTNVTNFIRFHTFIVY